MKPIIREYLASLKERGELDAILPDLLSELGYTVFSKPSRGTRQFGVDVAAIGPNGDDRVYLFSIKRGDLTRGEWNGPSDQALRPSLDEILDAYIPNHLPPEHRGKRVVICPCFGGEVQEAAAEAFNGYMNNKATDMVEFSVWNGDRIAGYLEDGLLREGLLSPEMRSSLRKAIAMSDEPEASFSHFARLVEAVTKHATGTSDAKRLTAARQISISLWMLFVWAREQGNLESTYQASEHVLLNIWDLAKEQLVAGTKSSEDMGVILFELVELHLQIWDEFIGKKILPHVGKLHAVSAAIRTASPLDVNLVLFTVMGRVALHGLWQIWIDSSSGELPTTYSKRPPTPRIDMLAEKLCLLVVNNPSLLAPVSEGQATDLAFGFMFLAIHGKHLGDLQVWVSEVVKRANFAYRSGGRYPSVLHDYAELAAHPRRDKEGYFVEVTQGSVLLPTLAFWAAALGDTDTLEVLARLKGEVLPHCSTQLWLPDESSETNLWRGQNNHGAAFLDIPLVPEGQSILNYILQECGPTTPFWKLSAVDQGFWPLVLVACRHHRLPIPPHFFSRLIPIAHPQS
ncbi:hypothetical protein [Acidiphilium iwatense]|uniref:Chemotaxis protein n=1 Tax=Acidiphilium iwatense TaxID=768198 RepID=A0ABS9DYW4_9PROT|nr:hypothetical protein [Acidiphilium iwatense]MCF3947345.1 hypothetical protein [Acidiphilium iwatense]